MKKVKTVIVIMVVVLLFFTTNSITSASDEVGHVKIFTKHIKIYINAKEHITLADIKKHIEDMEKEINEWITKNKGKIEIINMNTESLNINSHDYNFLVISIYYKKIEH